MEAFCIDDKEAILETCDFLGRQVELAHPPTNPDRPYLPAHTGRFVRTVDMGREKREILFYIPADFPPSGAAVILLADSTARAAGYWEDHPFLKKVSEKKKVMLILMEAGPGGWSKREIQKEFDYIERMLQIIVSKEFFSANESTFYLLGIGDGAYPATAYALAKPEKIAAFAADGDFELDKRLLKQLENRPASEREGYLLWDYPVSAWLLQKGKEMSETVRYILHTLRTTDCIGHGKYADIYEQSRRRFSNDPNDEICAKLWLGGEEELAGKPEEKILSILDFLSDHKRWFGNEKGHLRTARTPEDMGLIKYECEFEGRRRCYYLYAPRGYREGERKRRPLVMALHGYSCTGEMFAENTLWHAIAERKDFFVVYPTAYPGITDNNCTPLPMWRNGPAEWGTDSDLDDTVFLEHVLNCVEEKYAVDPGRVYVTGHSNGAVMTQILMNRIPERFAAAAPVGLTHGDLGILPFEQVPDTELPAWLMKGEYDIGCACDLSVDSPNYRKLMLLCRQNHIDETIPRYYENGRFRTSTYYDERSRPMVRFTEVAKLPHAYTAEMAELIWNEFFCRFRRNEKGETEYLG